MRVQGQLADYEAVVAPDFVGLGAALGGLGGARRVIVVADERTGPLWAHAAVAELRSAGHRVDVLVVPVDEARKDVHGWWAVVDGALRLGVDRASVLLALGGGVVGDLTGFAAASLLRGVDVVQVPTTLLAMVDSAIGGKTGFNHDVGKNLIGAFWQPTLMWAPLVTLGTLPERERRAGMGEVVKHALIAGEPLWSAVGELDHDASALARVVAGCLEVKARVVAADPHERGGREVLNLGHTVGHAVEREAGYGVVLHGEAVAMGLVVECAWAELAGRARPGLASSVRAALDAVGLPTRLGALDRDALRRAMRLDKKVRGAMIRMPVCEDVGRVVLLDLPLDVLDEVLEGAA